MIRGSRLAHIAWAALLAAALAALASSILWSVFMAYDDEGYVLYSLKNFAGHGRLYTEVYSQYGPFFFLFNAAQHALGLEFTNESARVLTLLYWCGTSLLCAAIVWDHTRSRVAATATALATQLHLFPSAHEPSHPGALIALLVALVGWLGTKPTGAARCVVVGTSLAALVLTKVNVGAFAVASLLVWHALTATRDPRRDPLVWCGGAAFVALPFVLMRPMLAEGWISTYAMLGGLAALTVFLAAPKGATPVPSPRPLFITLAAAAIAGTLTIGSTLFSGTTLTALLDGLLLGPLRHPGVYRLPITWRPGVLPLALASAAAAFWIVTRPPEKRGALIGPARLVVAAAYLAALAGWLPLNAQAFVLCYGWTAAWILVVPCRTEDGGWPARAWLAVLLVPQALHAFPVAGSQVAWGTFLWVPLVALALVDLAAAPTLRRTVVILGGLMTAGVVFVFAGAASTGWRTLQSGSPLALPGAERIVVPESLATALRILSQNTVAHGSTLFTYPGLHSFHLWTDVPAPTRSNATHWFSLLTTAQQEDIRAALAAAPRPVLIVQRELLSFLDERKFARRTALSQWLETEFERVFTVQGYEFRVRRGRAVFAAGTARHFTAAAAGTPRHKFEIMLALPEPVTVAHFQLRQFAGDESTAVLDWSAANAQIAATPMTREGTALTVAQALPLPGRLAGLVKIEIFTDEFPAHLAPGSVLIVACDASGRRVAEARLFD